MRKYKVVIAYDGTAYSGWQYQENAVGIQQVVEDALAYLDGAPVRVYGSSRTDAGVHAKGFVAHFHLTKPIPAKNLVRAMNARLPDAIRVLKASYAKEDFDARLSAKGKVKTYWNTNNGLTKLNEWEPNCWIQVTCPTEEAHGWWIITLADGRIILLPSAPAARIRAAIEAA